MAPRLVDSTLGAWEVGVMIMMFLYGVLASQTWTYYNSGSAGDRFLVRIIVRAFIRGQSASLTCGLDVGPARRVRNLLIFLYFHMICIMQAILTP